MKTLEAIQKCNMQYPHLIESETDFLGEFTLQTTADKLMQILRFFKEEIEPGYEVLMDLTAVDYVIPTLQTKIVYWLHNPTSLERLRICVYIGRDEALPSVTKLWKGANWYERELYDMFGVKFEGHPDLKRILMPDDWIGHPMRRDYPLTEEPVAFKHNVKPKVPSQIIQIRRDQKML